MLDVQYADGGKASTEEAQHNNVLFVTRCIQAAKWLLILGNKHVVQGYMVYYWTIPHTNYILCFNGEMKLNSYNRLSAIDMGKGNAVCYLAWAPVSDYSISIQGFSEDLHLLMSTLNAYDLMKDVRVREIEGITSYV